MFDGKDILITGGTGSFGKKYTEILLANYKPNRIVIYSRDEQKHYQMAQTFNQKCMRYFVGDVRDEKRLKTAMSGIDFVIHAAAMKHVPIAEYNPMECIRTNLTPCSKVIQNLVILSSVIGSSLTPCLISFLNNGTTEPFEPTTFPYLTTENLVSLVPAMLFAAINNLSLANFVAPYKFIGLQALSVLRAITFFTPSSNAAFMTF